MGKGDDVVRIEDVGGPAPARTVSFFYDKVKMKMDAGQDLVELSNTSFGDKVEIDGGKGEDEVVDGGGNNFVSSKYPKLKKVEIVTP